MSHVPHSATADDACQPLLSDGQCERSCVKAASDHASLDQSEPISHVLRSLQKYRNFPALLLYTGRRPCSTPGTRSYWPAKPSSETAVAVVTLIAAGHSYVTARTWMSQGLVHEVSRQSVASAGQSCPFVAQELMKYALFE